MSTPAILWFLGFGLLFMGERLFGESGARLPLSGLGAVLVVVSVVLRNQQRSGDDPDRKRAAQLALIAQLVGLSALLTYGLSLESVIEAVASTDEARSRWDGSFTALTPILWLAGTVPMLGLDHLLMANPRVVPPGSGVKAFQTGLATAFALAALFPLNYLVQANDLEYDAAYFRVTRPGSSTLAIVRGLAEPVEIKLFYPPGSDVKEEMLPYFREVADGSGGKLTVEVLDQPLVPELAEEYKIRENGYVVFVQGENTEKLKIQDDIDRARRDLKKLDQKVNQHLLELLTGKRTALFMVGHGEAHPREKDDPLRKLGALKKLLQAQNYKVEDFGVPDGSTDAVPDDVALVVLAAPTEALLPEETRTLTEYIAKGGRLLIMVEPGGEPLTELTQQLGITVGEHMLANESKYVPATRTAADRVWLFSNRFGSHASTATIAKQSSQLYVVLPTVAKLVEDEDFGGKITTLMRSYPETWEDANKNLQHDKATTAADGSEVPAEEIGVMPLAMAVSGTSSTPDTEYRAVVVGDVAFASDAVLARSAGNQQFILDTVRWLVGEEEYAGDVSSEEDVKIEHTREEDTLYFYGTIFAVPLFVLALGGLYLGSRRRRT